MCEFCVKHGDGKRWYLNAANYVEDLLSDARRQKYIADFVPDVTANAARWLRLMDGTRRVFPPLVRIAASRQARRMKSIHYGQVVPLEEVEAILGVVGQVVRLPCVCREVLEKRQVAVCYLLAASPERLGLKEIIGRRPEGEPYCAGMERVPPDKALAEMAALEEQGMMHTVWTFITPFIGGICNCDPGGCLAMNFSERGLPLYFPAEFKASVDGGRCIGCGDCGPRCRFGAIIMNGGPARVDAARCHGCGICRRFCPAGALALSPREAAPA